MTMQDDKRQQNVDHAEEARKHRSKHVALWVAVGGTMTLIAVLWFMLLPFQLSNGGKVSGFGEMRRWYSVRQDDGRGEASFQEALDGLGAQLEQLEDDQRKRLRAEQPPTGSSPAVRGEIDDLRAKIEATSKKNDSSVPVTNEATQ
jgi:type VI protein secretion system component VasF